MYHMSLDKISHVCILLGWSGGNMGLRPLGPKEIERLLVPPGKAYTLLSDHLIIDHYWLTTQV